MEQKQNPCELMRKLMADPGDKEVIDAIRQYTIEDFLDHAGECKTCIDTWARTYLADVNRLGLAVNKLLELALDSRDDRLPG